MKRHLFALPLAALTVGLSVGSLQAGQTGTRIEAVRNREVLASLVRDFYGISASHDGAFYVGSEMCMGCHSGPNAIHLDTSPWRNTLHARPFKDVSTDRYSMIPGKGIISDSNANGIDDFRDGLDFNAENQTAFEAFKPNAPVLGYSPATGYTMTIGQVTYRVFFAWGGNNMPAKQRYGVRIPVGDRANGLSGGTYVSPLQYNETTDEWVPYHPENWWESDGTPIFGPGADSALAAARGRSFDRKCSGCHFTGTLVRQDSFGEWVSEAAPAILVNPSDPTYLDMNGDGIKEITHIGCESCHGPGSRHIQQYGNPEKIVNPIRLSPQQANEACGACHVRGTSSEGTFDFPWDDTNDHRYVNGDSLDPYFVAQPGLWPDGKNSRQHHQQFNDFYQSSKPTSPSHMVVCTECHGPHIDTDKQILTEVEGIPTQVENNTLCLACHAARGPFAGISKEMVAQYEAHRSAIADVVETHTHHSYAPERRMGLSRCTNCHMPKVATSAIDYDIASHTFEAIPPEKTLQYQEQGGMPSSCAVSCHRNIVDIFPNSFDPSKSSWDEMSDQDLARWLMEYYGPDGKWWQTAP